MKHIRKRAVRVIIVVAVLISLVAIDAALLGFGPRGSSPGLFASQHDNQMATTTNSAITPGAPIGGAFRLTNQSGQVVSDRDFRGKYMLVFFGYSHCPDECPLTLDKMAMTIRALGPGRQHIVPIFITIDPVRDTPPVLKPYLAKFGAGLIGLTGSKSQISGVAREYAVAFNTNDLGASGASVVTHSTYIYLMGPDGKFLNLFPFTITVAQLTSVLKDQI